MNTRILSVGLSLGLLGAVAGVVGVQAQGISVEAQSGLVFPVVRSADFFEPGPTVGLQVGFGILDRVDLVVSGGYDRWSAFHGIGTPDMDLLRLEGGLEAVLLGDPEGNGTLRTVVSAGFTNFGSSEFIRQATPPLDPAGLDTYDPIIGPATFSKTYFSASLGLRIGFFRTDSGLTGSFGVDAHWSQMKSEDTEILREAQPLTLRKLEHTVSLPMTLSIGYGLF